MTKIDMNQITQMQFGLTTTGSLKNPPSARLVLPIAEGVGLYITGEIDKEQKAVDFEVPPISDYLTEGLKERMVIKDARFEVMVEGNLNGRKVYNVFVPWSGDIGLKESVMVESSEPVVKEVKEEKKLFEIGKSSGPLVKSKTSVDLDDIDDNSDYL